MWKQESSKCASVSHDDLPFLQKCHTHPSFCLLGFMSCKHFIQSPKNQPTENGDVMTFAYSEQGWNCFELAMGVDCQCAAKRTALGRIEDIEPSYKSTRDCIANGDWNQVLDQDVTPAQRSTWKNSSEDDRRDETWWDNDSIKPLSVKHDDTKALNVPLEDN